MAISNSMTKQKILDKNREYTFRSYLDLPYETDQILAEFDYSLIVDNLSLPHTSRELGDIASLKQRITETLPFISLSSETARRESLVSPVLLDLVRYCQCQLRFEYTLNVNSWLKGNLDYLVKHCRVLMPDTAVPFPYRIKNSFITKLHNTSAYISGQKTPYNIELNIISLAAIQS